MSLWVEPPSGSSSWGLPSPHHRLPSCPFSLLQYGFNLVMSHPHAVNEIALSLNNKNPR